MKYRISFGVETFVFDDGNTALGFVELAMKYFKPSDYCPTLKPYISIEEDKEDDEEC